MSHATWRDRADDVLRELFQDGAYSPTPAQINAAYPFGPRRNWPYKVWLERVKVWQDVAGGRLPAPRRPKAAVLPGQERLL